MSDLQNHVRDGLAQRRPMESRSAFLARTSAAMASDVVARWIAMAVGVAGYGVTISDPQHRLRWVNDCFTRLTGYSSAEVLNKEASDLLNSERADPQTLDRVRAAFATARGVRFELLARRKDGTDWWLETDAQPVLDAAGVLQAWVCVHSDITAHVRTREAALAGERRFATLLEAAPEAIIGVDDEGAIRFTNRQVTEMLGYLPGELLGAKVEQLIPARFHASHVAKRGAFVECPRTRPMSKALELLACRKDGTELPVEISLGRIGTDSGNVALCILRDVSEQKFIEGQRRRMQAELERAATQDRLTGLANRALFMERLQQAVARSCQGEQAPFAVFFLDFDRFKAVNDTLGHNAGDELLRQIGGRLRAVAQARDCGDEGPGRDLVARLGGDEFVMLVNGLASADEASRIAGRLLGALAPAYDIFGSEVRSTASVGIVSSDQCEGSAEEVLRNADVAMYEAKRAGRGRAVVFNDDLHAPMRRRAVLEAGLRGAIDAGDLALMFQPIVSLQTGHMVAVQARLCWNHPILGRVPPGEFMPIAEEAGLVVTLGEWARKQTCQVLRAWRAKDPQRAPTMVAIEVSKGELALGDRLVHRLRAELDQAGLDAASLQIEVAQHDIQHHSTALRETLNALRRLGVKLAMGQYGTGTSSLACLREYPFDTIKIAPSVLADASGSRDVLAVLHATINLIQNLGKTSLVDGVEELSQLAVLQSLGCHCAQGRLFGGAVPAHQLPDSFRAFSMEAPDGTVAGVCRPGAARITMPVPCSTQGATALEQ
jgi:diguanylate cyclase (GGDEF)-like protein/PAS domain S-box-containing protein